MYEMIATVNCVRRINILKIKKKFSLVISSYKKENSIFDSCKNLSKS